MERSSIPLASHASNSDSNISPASSTIILHLAYLDRAGIRQCRASSPLSYAPPPNLHKEEDREQGTPYLPFIQYNTSPLRLFRHLHLYHAMIPVLQSPFRLIPLRSTPKDKSLTCCKLNLGISAHSHLEHHTTARHLTRPFTSNVLLDARYQRIRMKHLLYLHPMARGHRGHTATCTLSPLNSDVLHVCAFRHTLRSE